MASKLVKSYAKYLLKRLNPTETEAALDKLIEFGFGLADKPNHFIAVLETEVKLRGI